ncbi:hypothetical protein RND71_022296 [Anisodus tanguticus]|uniref:phosphoribosylglycinamide formyltransferase 1 n=1 Tax=Anisodus tanguticus TaxID=243964 RepID=A0AAE1V923_9SOLA|nr:hypothetical protein RND71_022296 [Anisodus tanguticus]
MMRDCGGAKYAREQGIPVILFPKAKNSSEGLSEEDLVDVLRAYNIDFILLAGYLKLIPTELVRAFPRSIFNIHPSLLPAFGGKGYYGIKVHKTVIVSGASIVGLIMSIDDAKLLAEAGSDSGFRGSRFTTAHNVDRPWFLAPTSEYMRSKSN